MSLDGGSSIHSLYHDVVESLIHATDKLILAARKKIIYIPVEISNEFEFKNEFTSLKDKGVYLIGAQAAVCQQTGEKPEEWDREGTLTEFSGGSEVAQLRDFFIKEDRKRRGRSSKKSEVEGGDSPELPLPLVREKTFLPAEFREVDWKEHIDVLLATRKISPHYHRRALGAGGREYWKRVPIASHLVDGDDVSADLFLSSIVEAKRLLEKGDQEGLENMLVKAQQEEEIADEKSPRKKALPSPSDLRRYTINTHPALARAMCLIAEGGGEEEVRELMIKAAPKVAAEFERVTGRKVLGISIHFDSNLPHWNLWHSGLEPVTYLVGESERTRFRRTAMNLNASGNMLAWDRTKRSFEKIGEDFEKISLTTCRELKKAETRALDRQGRSPGDFTINRFADKILEEHLKDLGRGKLTDQGYKEFCENESKRYAAGVAGPNPRKLVKDFENLTRALNPAGRETLVDSAKRIVQERDEALRRTSEPTPPIIIEVVPQDLSGIREAVAEIPEEHRKNRSIADTIRLLWGNFQEAGVAVENAGQEIKVIRKEKEGLEEELKQERSLRKLAEATVKKLKEQAKWFESIAKRLVNAPGKLKLKAVINEVAVRFNILIDGMTKE